MEPQQSEETTTDTEVNLKIYYPISVFEIYYFVVLLQNLIECSQNWNFQPLLTNCSSMDTEPTNSIAEEDKNVSLQFSDLP